MRIRFVDNYLYYLMFTSILRGEILTIKEKKKFIKLSRERLFQAFLTVPAFISNSSLSLLKKSKFTVYNREASTFTLSKDNLSRDSSRSCHDIKLKPHYYAT